MRIGVDVVFAVLARKLDLSGLVLDRIEPGDRAGGRRRTVDAPVGQQGRVAAVRRHFVVDLVAVGPVPDGQHDVALDACGPRRGFLRKITGGDAACPIGEHLQPARAAIERHVVLHIVRIGMTQVADCGIAVLARLADARRPAFFVVVGQFARDFVAELMAEGAALFHVAGPVLLGRHGGRDAVAFRARAGELVGGRHFDQ